LSAQDVTENIQYVKKKQEKKKEKKGEEKNTEKEE